MRKLFIPVAAALAVALSALAFACGDDDGGGATAVDTSGPTQDPNAAAAQFTVQQIADAWNAGDADTFLLFFTEDGLKAFFADDTVTPAVVRENAADYLDPPFEITDFTSTVVEGDNATVDIALESGGVTIGAERYRLTHSGEDWAVVGRDLLPAPIPAGVTEVPVTATEFAYRFDDSVITGGNIAFSLSNEGQQFHELFLIKVNDDFTIDGLLEAGEDAEPPGVEAQIAGTFAAPGESSNLVFIDPVESGSYVMLCFIPDDNDPSGTPHVALGMHAALTIP